jgi:hypothetical protein
LPSLRLRGLPRGAARCPFLARRTALVSGQNTVMVGIHFVEAPFGGAAWPHKS